MTIVIPLFVSLISYAVVLTLKHIEYRATIDSLNKSLTSARTELASFNEKKKQEISDIIKSNEARINELTETISKFQSHANISLDETKVKILLFLSKQQDKLTDDDITQNLNINIQLVKFHLQELEKHSMVHADLYINSPCKWCLAQEGRLYLIENKLIS